MREPQSEQAIPSAVRLFPAQAAILEYDFPALNIVGNCLACFGPVEPLNFAVFQAFSRIRKNRRPGNRAVSQRGTPAVADFMEHEMLNKFLSHTFSIRAPLRTKLFTYSDRDRRY